MLRGEERKTFSDLRSQRPSTDRIQDLPCLESRDSPDFFSGFWRTKGPKGSKRGLKLLKSSPTKKGLLPFNPPPCGKTLKCVSPFRRSPLLSHWDALPAVSPCSRARRRFWRMWHSETCTKSWKQRQPPKPASSRMLYYWAVWFHIHVCMGIVGFHRIYWQTLKKLPMIHISHSSRISAFSPDSVFRVQLLRRSWMLRVWQSYSRAPLLFYQILCGTQRSDRKKHEKNPPTFREILIVN